MVQLYRWAAVVLACSQLVGVAAVGKDIQPPVSPQSPQSSSNNGLSTTLANQAASAPSTTASPRSVDLSSLLASLTSDLTASSSFDTSSLLASLSSQLTAIETSATAKQTTASSNTRSPSSPTPNPPNDGGVNSSQPVSKNRQNLTIILVVVLSVSGLTLMAIAFMCGRRYRQRRSPFSRLAKRGASPIDDDEIATWRKNPADIAQTPTHNHTRTASSIIFSPSPETSWTAHSPLPRTTSPITTSPSPYSQPYQSPPFTFSSKPRSLRTGSRSGSSHAEPTFPEPAALVARAPNSRCGLTDDTIPGADPFLPPQKRQSTRLSKGQGHARSKSRRSSKGSLASSGANTNPVGPGRFSFDRIDKGESTASSRSRTRSLTGDRTGLAMNPFIGSAYGEMAMPISPGGTNGAGLWPPPPLKRKMSFPEAMVGIAS